MSPRERRAGAPRRAQAAGPTRAHAHAGAPPAPEGGARRPVRAERGPTCIASARSAPPGLAGAGPPGARLPLAPRFPRLRPPSAEAARPRPSLRRRQPRNNAGPFDPAPTPPRPRAQSAPAETDLPGGSEGPAGGAARPGAAAGLWIGTGARKESGGWGMTAAGRARTRAPPSFPTLPPAGEKVSVRPAPPPGARPSPAGDSAEARAGGGERSRSQRCSAAPSTHGPRSTSQFRIGRPRQPHLAPPSRAGPSRVPAEGREPAEGAPAAVQVPYGFRPRARDPPLRAAAAAWRPEPAPRRASPRPSPGPSSFPLAGPAPSHVFRLAPRQPAGSCSPAPGPGGRRTSASEARKLHFPETRALACVTGRARRRRARSYTEHAHLFSQLLCHPLSLQGFGGGDAEELRPRRLGTPPPKELEEPAAFSRADAACCAKLGGPVGPPRCPTQHVCREPSSVSRGAVWEGAENPRGDTESK